MIVPPFDTPAPPAPPAPWRWLRRPPVPPLIAPLLVSVVIVPAFDTPAPPAPHRVEPNDTAAAVPPMIVPALVRVVIVAGIRHARAARAGCEAHAAGSAADRPAVGQCPDRAGVCHPCAARAAAGDRRCRQPPPLIVPLLVSVVIAPEFAIPAPPAAPGEALEGKAPPPRIVPLLVSVVIVAGIPDARAAAEEEWEAAAAVIAPLLVSVVIAPAFQTPRRQRRPRSSRRRARR